MKESDWFNCYSGSWNQAPLIPEAFSHPAKVSFNLAARIYQHAIEQGYIQPGSTVIDPFAGIGGFAFHAMLSGLHFVGCELEPRFVELGKQNIALWNDRYGPHLKRWGTARILQGDSRNLAALVGEAGAVVSSPPYADSLDHAPDNKQWVGKMPGNLKGNPSYGSTPGQLAALPAGDFDAAIGSPPYAETPIAAYDAGVKASGGLGKQYRLGNNPGGSKQVGNVSYGSTPGQLAALPAGSFDAAVSSPPYADAVSGNGEGPGARHDPIHHNGDNAYKSSSQPEYGRTPGNLGNMGGEGFDAVASSPPFEASLHLNEPPEIQLARLEARGANLGKFGKNSRTGNQGYGDHPANIGNDQGETFWSAARQIVEQVHAVLKPGGYAIWVCKRFVRNKQIVEFSEQWAQLCEAAGFERVEWVRAWLIEDRGVQMDIFGNGHDKSIKRSSFFRKLYEKKYPENAIDYEDVIIMRRAG